LKGIAGRGDRRQWQQPPAGQRRLRQAAQRGLRDRASAEQQGLAPGNARTLRGFDGSATVLFSRHKAPDAALILFDSMPRSRQWITPECDGESNA
jgi:hypothetical protein